MLLGADVRQLPSWSSGNISIKLFWMFWWLSPCDALNFQESLKHNCCKPVAKTSTYFEEVVSKDHPCFSWPLQSTFRMASHSNCAPVPSELRIWIFASILNRTNYLECCKSMLDKSVARVCSTTVLLKCRVRMFRETARRGIVQTTVFSFVDASVDLTSFLNSGSWFRFNLVIFFGILSSSSSQSCGKLDMMMERIVFSYLFSNLFIQVSDVFQIWQMHANAAVPCIMGLRISCCRNSHNSRVQRYTRESFNS